MSGELLHFSQGEGHARTHLLEDLIYSIITLIRAQWTILGSLKAIFTSSYSLAIGYPSNISSYPSNPPSATVTDTNIFDNSYILGILTGIIVCPFAFRMLTTSWTALLDAELSNTVPMLEGNMSKD